MKQKLLYIIMFIATLVWSNGAWGQTTPSYLLNDNGSYQVEKVLNFTDWDNGTLTFSYWRENSTAWVSQKIKVFAYTEIDAGGTEIALGEYETPTSSTSSPAINILKTYRSIKFKSSAGTKKKYVSNVQIIRKTYIEDFPYSTSVAYNMGTVKSGKSITTYIKNVKYHNSYYPRDLTFSSTSTDFSVGSVSVSEEVGFIDVPVSFCPSSTGDVQGNITLKIGTDVVTFKVTGKGANKGVPNFIWNIGGTVKAKKSYKNFFTTTNGDCAYTVTSSDPEIAQYVNGKLYFPGKTGSVRVTISQVGNNDWEAKTEYRDFIVEEAQNHVEFTINSSEKYNIFVIEESNPDRIAYDNGIRLGTTSQFISVSDRNDKYVIIEFSGIPDKLSFTTTVAQSGLIPSGISFYVQEMDEDGYNIGQKWTSTSKDNTVTDRQLQPETRKLKICYSGNYWAHIKNLKVTEKRYLTVSPTNPIDFGTKTKGNSYEQTFTVSHCNAGNGVTVICSDASNFEVNPTTLTTTGPDLMDTETVTVRYLNNTVGEHNNKTITIRDVNGTNAAVTLTVSGTTQTTYHTRAVAAKSGNGSAYITDNSDNAGTATSTSITANSGLVTTENAQKTVYLRAVPDEGYKFVEWQKDGVQVSTNASDTKSYSYNSESSSLPTEVTYTAIFAPKTLTINPVSTNYEAGKYAGTVTFARNLKSGYSTIALPFAADVEELVGNDYDADDDWVAQLSSVTYNAQDGYSLYFEKTNTIKANQPYILHLATAVDSPVFTNVDVVAAEPATQKATKGVHVDDWVMHSNYDPTFDMNGYYGVVGEQIKKGTTGATLKAFHAYITGPAAAPVKAAYLDEDEADGILELLNAEATEPENIYDLQGRQLPRAGKGINIIRNADGTVRKVMLK